MALVALLGPTILAEPAIVVQPAELAEPTEPEPLPDEDLHDEPGLLDLSICHIIQTEKSCGSDENSKKKFSTLVFHWKETEQETNVLHPIYAILVTQSAWICRPGANYA